MTRAAHRFIDRPSGTLAQLLSAPPTSFGPVPMWWWSGDRLDPLRLRRQLEHLSAGGVRQVVVMNLAPCGPLYGALADEPEFFSDEWWSLLLGVCRDAAELGMRLWFYDQLGFSGADLQGRLVSREPSYRGWSLERPTDQLDPVRTVRRGFDYLSPVASAALIDSVHGEFERRLGEHLGTTVVGSFQDELASMPTWTSGFADEFLARRGYDLRPVIAALWDEVDGDSATVRVDYQRTRAELAEEAFFRPLHEWHEQRGLAVGCDQQHPARAGYPLEATQQYGDYLRTHRWFSAPGSDHWGEAKVHSSLAHLYDRPRTWVEAFHTTGWGGTLEETYDWLLPWLRAGATLFNPHAVYYSTRGGRWEWAPPSTCWRQPYWQQYPLLATTVTRLCAALSWGRHVCDVAVLFPTATAAADLPIDLPEVLLGQPAGTSAAQDAYLDVVGRMHWWEARPGVLDADGRDFDVVDDDSLVRASFVDGALRIGDESYRAVVLPGCRVLEPATAAALAAYAEAGGLVVAVGDVAAALRPLVDAAVISHVVGAGDLPDALRPLARRVVAPVPTLLRSDGDSALLLVVGAHPGATLADREWKTAGYDFDPARYAHSTTVTVVDVAGPVALCDPGTGVVTALPARVEGGALRVEIPLHGGPAALVLFGPAAAQSLAAPAAASAMAVAPPQPGGSAADQLRDGWTAELLPTMDNEWGDFAGDATPGPMPVQVWRMEQLRDDGGWSPARATFGTYGSVIGDDGVERSVVLSTQLGVAPETAAVEPRGFVGDDFLDVGDLADGGSARLHLPVFCNEDGPAVLTVGSTADVQVWWNGRPADLTGGPQLHTAQVEAHQGTNSLELVLVAASARRVRALWTLRSVPDLPPRPQWLAADGAETVLRRTWSVPTTPLPTTSGLLQLGTVGRVTLRVNGEVLARHGESDNYTHVRQPRVRRYSLEPLLQPGENDVELVLHEPESAAVVDAVAADSWLVTDGTWRAQVDGAARPVRGVVEVPHDPRWAQLRPRAHPLPHGHRLERSEPDPHRLGVPCAAGAAGATTFRFRLPPGATAVELPVAGRYDVGVEGCSVERTPVGVTLAPPAAGGATCTVVVTPPTGGTPLAGGALWSGPAIVHTAGSGSMPLGDWAAHGLSDYSGGLRYRRVVTGIAGDATLDLGAVRGTAQVRVDGRDMGVRIWSPYRFALTGLVARGSVLEVEVLGTLGPYQAAVSPTPWVLPGQETTGLLGPVVLHAAARPEA